MSMIAKIAAFGAVLLSVTTAGAQEITLRMAILGGVGKSAYGVTMSQVPEAISKATDGRVKVDIYDSLIPGTQLANSVREGTIDMIGAVHVYLTGEEPRFGIGHLPGLLTTSEEYKTVLDAYMADLIEEAWDTRYNSHALAHGIWYDAPHFSNKPLKTLEDFKGLKIRTHNPEAAAMLTAIGAHPTQIAAGEMTTALQRGVIDALSTEYGSALSLGVQEAAAYASVWDFSVNLGWTVAINKNSWSKIPDDLKEQITQGMKAFQEARFAAYEGERAAITKEMTDAGVEFVPVAPEEQQKAFTEENVKGIYDGWYARAQSVGVDGPAVIAEIRKILGK